MNAERVNHMTLEWLNDIEFELSKALSTDIGIHSVMP